MLKENSAETNELNGPKKSQDQLTAAENTVVQTNGDVASPKTDRSSDTMKISEQNLDVPVPLLDLDQEEIEKIEHALQSEQARQILGGGFGGILGPSGTEAELDDLLDPELTGGYYHDQCLILSSINICLFL